MVTKEIESKNARIAHLYCSFLPIARTCNQFQIGNDHLKPLGSPAIDRKLLISLLDLVEIVF